MFHYNKKGKYYRLQNPTCFDSKDFLVINREESNPKKSELGLKILYFYMGIDNKHLLSGRSLPGHSNALEL